MFRGHVELSWDVWVSSGCAETHAPCEKVPIIRSGSKGLSKRCQGCFQKENECVCGGGGGERKFIVATALVCIIRRGVMGFSA